MTSSHQIPGPMLLALRSLIRYRGRALLAIIGIAAASAAITGALAVGDSVTAGLRRLLLARIGSTTHVVTGNHPLPLDLADRLIKQAGILQTAPALISSGAVRSEDTGAVAPSVQVTGIDSRFGKLFSTKITTPEGMDCVVNRQLADVLKLSVGSEVTLQAAKSQVAPSDTLFAHTHVRDALSVLRLRVNRVLPDAGAGSFSLSANASPQPSIFLSIDKLEMLSGENRDCSAILVRADPASPEAVYRSLRNVMTLNDCGLKLRQDRCAGAVNLESSGLLLSKGVLEAARKVDTGDRDGATSVLLATRLSDENSGKAISYSVCASGDSTALKIKAGEIALNRAAAEQLNARIADLITLECLQPNRDGSYSTLHFPLRVARVMEMHGAAADPYLTPNFHGISNARTMTDWDPPFPFDMDRITPADEDYWRRYHGAPRAFVPEAVAQAAWPSSGGWITSYRFCCYDRSVLTTFSHEVEGKLVRSISPDAAGLTYRPIRKELVEAASGSTDFSGLFLGMGLFVVLAGVWLAVETLRAGISERATETGLLLAAGWTPAQVSQALWLEQALIAASGAISGCIPGAIYAAWLLQYLDRRFQLGGALRLEVRPVWWLVGAACAAVIGSAALWLPCRSFGRSSPRELLCGTANSGLVKLRPNRQIVIVATLAIASICLTAAGSSDDPVSGSRPLYFFCAGVLLLTLGVPILNLCLAALRNVRCVITGPGWLVFRALAASPGKSRILAGLAATSSFILASVAGSVRTDSLTTRQDRLDGTGGFALVARLTNPVALDFATPQGRHALGFSADEEVAFQRVQVFSMLRSAGDAAGCENMARANAPILLGAGKDLVARGGFLIEPNSDITRGPWRALEWDSGRAVPAFGDADTVEWILHSGVGKQYRMPIAGRNTDLRFIGVMPGSIFTSELVISQDAFLKLGAGSPLPGYFLIDVPQGKEDAVAAALRTHLGEIGLDVRTTRSIIGRAASIQNSYLSAFLALGAIAALLSLLAISASGARRAIERRREYAILLALGYRTADVVKLPSLEMAIPAVVGVVWGSACACIALWPALTSRANGPQVIAGVVLPCLGMMTASILCSALTARMARRPLMEAMRAE